MTVTIHLPPEKEAAFQAQAQARGLSLEQWRKRLPHHSVNIGMIRLVDRES